MALTVEEVLQRLLEEDSDEDEKEVGDFADEDGTTVTLDPTVLSAALPNSEPPAEDSLLLSDRELLEQLDSDTFNAEDSIEDVDKGTGVRVAATSGGHYLEQLAIDTFNAEDSTEDNDEGSSVDDTSSNEDNEGTSVGAASGRRQTTEYNPEKRSYTTERGRGRRGTRGRGCGRRGSQGRAREESSEGVP